MKEQNKGLRTAFARSAAQWINETTYSRIALQIHEHQTDLKARGAEVLVTEICVLVG